MVQLLVLHYGHATWDHSSVAGETLADYRGPQW